MCLLGSEELRTGESLCYSPTIVSRISAVSIGKIRKIPTLRRCNKPAVLNIRRDRRVLQSRNAGGRQPVPGHYLETHVCQRSFAYASSGSV